MKIKTIKIQVEASKDRHHTTAINAQDNNGFISITRRQYENAAKRLKMISGDSLRLSPIGPDVDSVIVYDGTAEWAVVH